MNDNKKGVNMNDNEKLVDKKAVEFYALTFEAKAILTEIDAMKVANTERTALNEPPAYGEIDFMQLAVKMKIVSDKLRKLLA